MYNTVVKLKRYLVVQIFRSNSMYSEMGVPQDCKELVWVLSVSGF